MPVPSVYIGINRRVCRFQSRHSPSEIRDNVDVAEGLRECCLLGGAVAKSRRAVD